MKKLFLVLAFGLVGLCTALPSAAYVLSITPSKTAVATVGNFFNLQIIISGLQDPPTDEIVSGFDLNMLYDSTIIRASSVVHEAVPKLGGLNDTLWDASFDPGNLGIFNLSLLNDDAALIALQGDDSLLLATIGFEALKEGITSVAFGPDPDLDHNVTGLNAQTLPVTLKNACVSIGQGFSCDSQIPEPGTLALVMLALAGLGAARRCYKWA